MDTEQQQSNNCDSDKCQKVKRFVIVGLLITIGILSWHFYGTYTRSVTSVTSYANTPPLFAHYRVFSFRTAAADTGRCALPIADALQRRVRGKCVSVQGEFAG